MMEEGREDTRRPATAAAAADAATAPSTSPPPSLTTAPSPYGHRSDTFRSNSTHQGSLSAPPPQPSLSASPASDSIFGPAGPSSQAHAQQPPLSTLQSATVFEAPISQPMVDGRRLPTVEKDADDPTTPPASSRDAIRRESTTLITLSRLFAVQAATSPEVSRHTSYVATSARPPLVYNRAVQQTETAALPDHLFTRGLLSGRHSDITVNAFGQRYHLHRLILDRAPFFSSALSEPWLEANAREMTVHPEDIDPSITQAAFELALKRLYGASNAGDEDQDPVGLFATACWLEMQDLIDASVKSMLRQMTPDTLSPLIKLVTSNYYGRAGDKVLASAKSMLCRDGWRMSLRFWDGIPGDVIREIVGGDGFFIDGEWDRWVLAKRILDRRLRTQAAHMGLLDPETRRRPLKVPDASSLMAIRFDSVYRRSNPGTGEGIPDSLHRWVALYTHPDVEPILVLLDEGIHYLHLDFEQLQYIRDARDCLGLPVMPEKVVSNALWQQMELRQRVMNSREANLELGLSVQCSEDSAWGSGRDTTMSIMTPSEPQNAKDKQLDSGSEERLSHQVDSGSWDSNGKPRKFWIPTSDCNIVMGGNSDPVIATSNNTTMQRHASRLSATIQPEDVQWVADFAAATSQPRPTTSAADGHGSGPEEALSVSYSHFPPFRFAAEFPNPRSLKEKKRVYSRTVFYAGSLWNIYIQKVASSRSKQLGVYLHRAKERETEEVIAGTAGLAQGSVDERIGQLEREMILRSERRERRMRRRTTLGADGMEADGGESSGSAGDPEGSLMHGSLEPGARSSMMRNVLARGHHKSGQTDVIGSSPPQRPPHGFYVTRDDAMNDSDTDDSAGSETERLAAASNRFHVPTLPPYVDARPTIKTYFKIYSPSRGGRMLSVYESAPDKFNFSQSWGWKSSTLMLDEGLLGDDGDDMVAKEDPVEQSRTVKERGDGKLRFMVVIGNI